MSEFGTLDLDEMASEDARLKDKGGASGFLDQFVPMPEVRPGQTGTVTVRILPPVKGGKLFQYNRYHGLNGRKSHCPRPLTPAGKWDYKVPCPVCDRYHSMWKKIEKLQKDSMTSEAEAMKRDARKLKAVERYYYNVIVRSMKVGDKEQTNVGPRILSVGVILHGKIIAGIFGQPGDPSSKLGNITAVKDGWDFIIRKSVEHGEDGFPKYDKSDFARITSVLGTPDQIEVWQKNLHDLTKLRSPRDVEYLEKELAIHLGMIPDETDTFDNEGFEAKWSARKNEAAKTIVTVPNSVPTRTEPLRETVHVEDEAFMKELDEMEAP